MSETIIPTVKAKTIMQPTKHGDFWFGGDYGMNLYRGCNHGCIYCDSRSSCYRVENFDQVRMKEDALKILDRELWYKKKGVVSLGAMSDHYNPYEKVIKLTRGALELIEKHGFGLSFETKSDLILRDLDLFEKINKKHSLILKMTITCADDELSKMIEPHVCVSSKRFAAIKQLSDAGLFTGILFTPWLPFITDNEENVKEMVRKAKESGAKFIYAQPGVTLRDNQRDYYYEKLDVLFPGLSDRYRKCYREKYMCTSLDRNLIKVFESECQKYGLLFKMKDIIRAYKKERGVVQQVLF